MVNKNLEVKETYDLEVKTASGKQVFQKRFQTKNEAKTFWKNNTKSVSGWGYLFMALTPLRTDNVKDFCKDFFLPGFVNLAHLVDGIALRIFVTCLLLPLDAITFPVRLVTTPLRAAYSHMAPVYIHPLKKKLGDSVKNEKFLNVTYKSTETSHAADEIRGCTKKVITNKKTTKVYLDSLPISREESTYENREEVFAPEKKDILKQGDNINLWDPNISWFQIAGTQGSGKNSSLEF